MRAPLLAVLQTSPDFRPAYEPLVGMATKGVLGTDLLMDAGVDWKAYNKLIAARESAVRINADRKVAQEEMAALSAKKNTARSSVKPAPVVTKTVT